MKKLTKEEFLTCLEHCLDAGTCDGCPLVKETFTNLGKTSCTRFMLIQLRELFPILNSTIDIPRIIDEAMEKKNRSVTVFVGPQGTTVNVYPYQEAKPYWTSRDNHYICSECRAANHFPSPYCPICGEKMCISDTEEKPEVAEDEPETPVE